MRFVRDFLIRRWRWWVAGVILFWLFILLLVIFGSPKENDYFYSPEYGIRALK